MKRYNNFCGNENIDYVFYNEWADPEIFYKGFKWSAWEADEALKNHLKRTTQTERRRNLWHILTQE